MIPKIIHRTIPRKTTPLMDFCWSTVLENTSDWEHITHYDEDNHPIIGEYLPLCTAGAFRADLIRLEALYLYGGVYLDSDVELIKPIDNLIYNNFFSVRESCGCIGNSVMGSTPENKIVKDAIEYSIHILKNNLIDESSNCVVNANKKFSAFGPHVITETLKNQENFTILDTKSFFPYSYGEKRQKYMLNFRNDSEVYGIHKWAKSW